MKTPLTVTVAVLVLWMSVTTARADDAAEIKALIPAAAGMSLRDFDKLAASTTLSAADTKSKTLSLMLLTMAAGADDEKTRAEFRYLTERGAVPRPAELAKEMGRFARGTSKFRFALGPITMIHADRITACTCKVDGDTATGTVSFTVPKLYQGKVDYIARKRDKKWRIEQFKMPARGLHITLAEGVWTKK